MPHLLKTREKRRLVKEGFLDGRDITSYHDAPIVGFPTEGHEALERFARKLTCALYYKHIGTPLPLEYYISTFVFFYSQKNAEEPVRKLNEVLPNYTRTGRVNTDIGDQFHYRYGVNNDEDLFGFMAQFSRSFFVVGAASSQQGSLDKGWRQHLTDFH